MVAWFLQKMPMINITNKNLMVLAHIMVLRLEAATQKLVAKKKNITQAALTQHALANFTVQMEVAFLTKQTQHSFHRARMSQIILSIIKITEALIWPWDTKVI